MLRSGQSVVFLFLTKSLCRSAVSLLTLGLLEELVSQLFRSFGRVTRHAQDIAASPVLFDLFAVTVNLLLRASIIGLA